MPPRFGGAQSATATDFVIDGVKSLITCGGSAATAMVVAVTDPDAGKHGISAFLIRPGAPGDRVLRAERKRGHRTNDTWQVTLEDLAVPADDMPGAPGAALKIAFSSYIPPGDTTTATAKRPALLDAFQVVRASGSTRTPAQHARRYPPSSVPARSNATSPSNWSRSAYRIRTTPPRPDGSRSTRSPSRSDKSRSSA